MMETITLKQSFFLSPVRWLTENVKTKDSVFLLLSLSLAALIFILDLSLDLGFAAPILFVGVIWLASHARHRYSILTAMLSCSVLTLLGWYLSSPGSLFENPSPVLFNRTLALFVIWTTGIVLNRERELFQDKLELTWIADQTPSLLIICNSKGLIQWTNQAFFNLTGILPQLARGREITSLFSGLNLDNLKESSQNTSNSKRILELRYQNKEGEWLSLELSAEPIFNTKNKLRGYFFIGTDISDQKQMRYDLETSNAELKQFAYVASHDLQEPLRKIICYLQILEEDYKKQLPEDAIECIDYAVDGGQRLKRLIEDLLRLSGVTRSDKTNITLTDFNDVMSTVEQELETAIEESDCAIEYSELPIAHADRGLMEQLFQNLIANGIKYKKDGAPPRITISSKRVHDSWLFSVKDNGIGIEQEHFDRIFMMFQRLHRKSDYPGTGIGLAVCKKIIERHRGRIWVESKKEKGSTFLFTIPDSRRGEHV